MKIQIVHEVVSEGKSSVLLSWRELGYLSDTVRQALNEAEVVSRIGEQEALSIKAGMRMSWANV